MTFIVSHRGLDIGKSKPYLENSKEALKDKLEKGYGVEFDIRLTKDFEIVICHDPDLERISSGKDKRKISEVGSYELLSMNFEGEHLIRVEDLVLLFKKYSINGLHTLHLKAENQEQEFLEILIEKIKELERESFLIFDTKISTAKYLKEKDSSLKLAPSVAHPYDIKRYNKYTGETLITLEEAIKNKDLFDWVWLDEWDLNDERGREKTLYNKEIFNKLRANKFKIGLVTPELHASLPGHQDANNKKALFARIESIILELEPDLICTDYPTAVKKAFFQR